MEKTAIVLPVKKFAASLPFVELRSVLFCLREPATGCHPESGESSVHSFALCFIMVHLTVSSHLLLGLTCCLTIRFLRHCSMCIFYLFCTFYMTVPCHTPGFDNRTNIR